MENNCPCCPNHCDVNNLNCGRGREYFQKGEEETRHDRNHKMKDESEMSKEELTLSKIRRCGHFLHHSNKEVNLEFLSESEQEELNKLLSKCLDNWN